MENNKHESYNFIVNKIFIAEFKNSCKLNFIGVWIYDILNWLVVIKINFIC